MRKAILTSLLAGACVAAAGNVGSDVGANVKNVCIFQASGLDVADNDVAGTSINLGNYRANAGIAPLTTLISMIQCNRGTVPVTSSLPDPILLARQEGSGSPLEALVQFGTSQITSPAPGQNDPTVFRVRATVEAEAGQWGVQGGTYRGTAVVTLTYN